jgi:hypothetical protein
MAFRLLDTTTQPGVPKGFRLLDEVPAAPAPPVGVDIGKSIVSNLGQGGAELLGLPGTMAEGTIRGFDFLRNKVTGQPRLTEDQVQQARQIPFGNSSFALPTGEEISRGFEKSTGVDFYQPKTEAGQVAGRMARPVAGALAFGGGIRSLMDAVVNVAKFAVAPASMGEVAARGLKSVGGNEDVQNIGRTVAEIGTGGAASMMRPRDVAPSVGQLTKESGDAFKRMAAAGVVVNQPSMARFATNLQRDISSELTALQRANAVIAPKTTAMLDAIAESGTQSATLDDLHGLRKAINVAIQGADEGDRRLLMKMRAGLDDFLDPDKVTPSMFDRGNGTVGTTELSKGIRTYARAKRAEDIEEAVARAKTRVDPKTSYNLDDALRAEFRTMIRNKDAMRVFRPNERDAIRQIANGAPIERALAGLAPGNNVAGILKVSLYTGAGLGGFGPLAAIPPAVGMFGRAASRAATVRNASNASQLVRSGAGSVPSGPMMAPLSLYYGVQNMATTPPPGR